MDFGEELRRILREKGMSQTGLSKMTNISKTTIRNWYHDYRSPSLDNAEFVLDALGYEIKIVKKEGK